ncbi:response regulator [Flavobacterium wongokense]|uniref:response regulator n=1 Tax=Flavobacterium wongokense TaxID=2910674 RepID=UPI001F402B1B|nr:response regulator [Flavobacterium sp. WG47]MCF6133231.1 response regulator [Flavobacterium sp. WG47]
MELHKPLTIFIADDDEDDRELLKFLFNQNEKFEVIGYFDSGIEVVKEILIKKNIPDILLIDMYMPLLNGTEVVKKITESGEAMDMQKFVISTQINTTEQNKYIDDRTVKFLKKPTSLAEIHDLPGIILETLHIRNNTKV